MTRHVLIDYTNYRGERKLVLIEPDEHGLFFGTTAYHTSPQWLMRATDVERDLQRIYAMADIHSWKPQAPEFIRTNDVKWP